jgi:DNA polymerase-1
MTQRHLLLDGDVYAYRAAAGVEEVTNWGDDTDDGALFQVTADLNHAKAYIDRAFEQLMDELEGTNLVLTLSDSQHNWRRDVLPTYKSNRSSSRRPIILPQCRAYLRERYKAWERPGLEGDDVLGILAGLRSKFPGERVIVTCDKDLNVIPGLHYRMHQSVLGIFEVSTAEADLFHLRQGIAGDPVDGYSGCPGMGMETAKQFLDEPYLLVPEERTFQRGKRAGETITRWVKQDPGDASLWECILSLYAKEGLTEADALVQFQVARILRFSDYDFQKKEPLLWTPALIP